MLTHSNDRDLESALGRYNLFSSPSCTAIFYDMFYIIIVE